MSTNEQKILESSNATPRNILQYYFEYHPKKKEYRTTGVHLENWEDVKSALKIETDDKTKENLSKKHQVKEKLEYDRQYNRKVKYLHHEDYNNIVLLFDNDFKEKEVGEVFSEVFGLSITPEKINTDTKPSLLSHSLSSNSIQPNNSITSDSDNSINLLGSSNTDMDKLSSDEDDDTEQYLDPTVVSNYTRFDIQQFSDKDNKKITLPPSKDDNTSNTQKQCTQFNSDDSETTSSITSDTNWQSSVGSSNNYSIHEIDLTKSSKNNQEKTPPKIDYNPNDQKECTQYTSKNDSSTSSSYLTADDNLWNNKTNFDELSSTSSSLDFLAGKNLSRTSSSSFTTIDLDSSMTQNIIEETKKSKTKTQEKKDRTSINKNNLKRDQASEITFFSLESSDRDDGRKEKYTSSNNTSTDEEIGDWVILDLSKTDAKTINKGKSPSSSKRQNLYNRNKDAIDAKYDKIVNQKLDQRYDERISSMKSSTSNNHAKIIKLLDQYANGSNRFTGFFHFATHPSRNHQETIKSYLKTYIKKPDTSLATIVGAVAKLVEENKKTHSSLYQRIAYIENTLNFEEHLNPNNTKDINEFYNRHCEVKISSSNLSF